MSGAPLIELRAQTESDADVLFGIAADQATWEERNPSSPAPLTRAAYDAGSARADGQGEAERLRFVIEADGDPVGSISLFGFDHLARHAELGIALAPHARGRGIGTEAIVQIAEFAFVRRNTRRLHLQAIASNLSAIRAYEKAGFSTEGRLREHAWVRGGYEDVVVMGLLRSEWAERAEGHVSSDSWSRSGSVVKRRRSSVRAAASTREVPGSDL